MQTWLWILGLSGLAWLAYLVYIELRSSTYIWRDPCITPADRREDLRHIIRSFKEVADRKGVRWWLDYGTLLGAWRLGDIMAYDHDLDLSFLGEDMPLVEACRDELLERGIEINLERTSFFYKGIKMGDLEPWWPYYGDRLCRSHPDTREGLLKVIVPLFDDFPAEWVRSPWSIRFLGEWYPCPSHPERLLRRRFPTLIPSLRLCFPHKQRCWICPDFWREAWRIWRERRFPVTRPTSHGT